MQLTSISVSAQDLVYRVPQFGCEGANRARSRRLVLKAPMDRVIMFSGEVPVRAAADSVVGAIRRLQQRDHASILVALDGPSGSGKSTIADAVAAALPAIVVPCDDFFAADVTDEAWASLEPIHRSAVVIDWQRLRHDALEPLLAGRPAAWQAFDFQAGPRPDGSYGLSSAPTRRPPGDVVLLEGAYSTHPKLADLIDISVLVIAPVRARQQRLAEREDAAFLASWHDRWDAAEAHYFTSIRPPSAFDVIVHTADDDVDAN